MTFLIGALLVSSMLRVSTAHDVLQRDTFTKIYFGDFECYENHVVAVTPELRAGQTVKVGESLDCGFACTRLKTCFSYNFGLTPDGDGKHVCELLSTDKYNNSGNFQGDANFHHFAIRSPCSTNPCLNGGQCVALYRDNDFTCSCTAQFKGKTCDTYAYLVVYIRGTGLEDPSNRFPPGEEHKASIKVNGVERSQMGRGHNIVVVNMDGTVETSVAYDTHDYPSAGSQIASHINSIPQGRLVLVAVQDNSNTYYSAGVAALKSIGAVNPHLLYRESWYLIGHKGESKAWIREGRATRTNGPASITVQIPTS